MLPITPQIDSKKPMIYVEADPKLR